MSTANNTSLGYFLSRVFWMAVGPMSLAILAIAIVNSGSGWLTLIDAAFFVVLACMLAARWFEFQSGDAETATGEAAGETDLQKYLAGALLIGGLIWLVANLLGNHFLNG